MASLWTPEGEHRVTADGGGESGQKVPPSDERTEGADASVQSAQDEASFSTGDAASDAAIEQDLAALEQELLSAKTEDVVANHCYGLFQLAALYLGSQPPRLDDARLAIDALSSIVESLGERLGRSTETMRDALAQIRLAYVQIAGAMTTANGVHGTHEPSAADGTKEGDEAP